MGDNQTEDDDLISQDDIDALLQSSQIGGLNESDDNDDDDDDISMLISQEDISKVLNTQSASAEKLPADVPPEETTGNDDVIQASEATAVQDCLMTQDALDALIADVQGPQQQELSSADPDEEDLPEPEAAELDIDMDQIESELVSQEDIDDLLSETDEDEDTDVSEDMDILLDDPAEDNMSSGDDILISQDDIDALLTASDQEDEDILGDLLGIDPESDSVEADDDDIDYEIEEEDPDQVVLEGMDLPAPSKGPLKKKKKEKQWYRSKRVLACISGILFLIVLLPVAYFVFVSPAFQENRSYQPLVVQEENYRDVEVDSVDIDLTQKSSAPMSGTMVLKDFLVLAAEDSKSLTYIAADIAIDYSDRNAYIEINNNLPFYRELIYESIQKSLHSDQRDDITEPDLVEGVELDLKKVFPEHYIHRIRFEAFKTG